MWLLVELCPVSSQTGRKAGIQRPDMYGVSGQAPDKTAPMFTLSFPRWPCKYCHILKPLGLCKSTSGRKNSYVLGNSCEIRGRATWKGYCHRMTYWLRSLHSGSKELCPHTARKLQAWALQSDSEFYFCWTSQCFSFLQCKTWDNNRAYFFTRFQEL